MEKVLKGYIFRMCPNEEQINLIEKVLEYQDIYNYFLEKNQNNKYFNKFNYIKELPSLCSQNKWLKEVDSCLLRCSIFNLEDSYKRYNNKISEYPKYKGKYTSRKTYRTNNITRIYNGKTYNSISLDLKNKTIKLPKLKEMVQNKNISKKILDASWQELLRQMKYKSKWLGKEVFQIDSYYPSSQICSHCEYQNKEIKDLKIRNWICPICMNKNNRDINASINIMFEEIKKYMKKAVTELQVI